MHWFGGSIAEAVTLSKQRNAIFVVFVEGDNDLSIEMAATIDDTAVVDRLSDQGNFLAVKLKSGSTNYTHFAQIYQFVPVPSLFFIGRNGTPLEVVCAGVQPSNLATRIDKILEEHHKDNKPSPSSASGHAVREQTVSFLQTEAAVTALTTDEKEKPREQKTAEKTSVTPTEKTAEKKPAEHTPEPSAPPAKLVKPNSPEETHTVVCEGGVCKRVPKTDEAGPSQAPTPTLPVSPVDTEDADPMEIEGPGSIEEKMERAKELIEARRREKADKDKEADKQKEKDRRAQGKGVAELKRWQAEQELKQIQEERKREKMANDLARQRVLEQIAQDRAERRARDAPASAPAPATTPTAPAAAPQASQPAATSGDSGGRARIQFKLPDGTSHTAHFDALDTLATVQRYVADNLQLSTSSFSLWTAFPRRELTEVSESLRGLQLAPSAALLVLARRPAPVVAAPPAQANIISFLTHLFATLILEPTQQLYIWLRARLFPRAGNTPRDTSPSAPQPPQQPGVAGLRRRGNIHRLPNDRASDDDNNTWNGNSTQQM